MKWLLPAGEGESKEVWKKGGNTFQNKRMRVWNFISQFPIEKEDICIVSKISSLKYELTKKRRKKKIVNLQ